MIRFTSPASRRAVRPPARKAGAKPYAGGPSAAAEALERRTLLAGTMGPALPAGGGLPALQVLSDLGRDDRAGPLSQIYRQFAADVAGGRSNKLRVDSRLMRTVDNGIYVEMSGDDLPAIRAGAEALGMSDVAVSGGIIGGLLPIAAVPALRSLPGLWFARPSMAGHNVGAVTTAGDWAMGADDTRAAFNVNGAGVRIGVISDSYNALGGETADKNSGDLPATATYLADLTGGSDEGRAMMQIVHDLAPGAELLFHTGGFTLAHLAQAIRNLSAVGSDVIVDDLFHPYEAFYSDGDVAQAAREAVSQGITYLTAAGNDGRLAYENPFTRGTAFGNGAFGYAPFVAGYAHDFDPGPSEDFRQSFTLPPGQHVDIVLQWNNAFRTSPTGIGPQSNVDAYVLNAAGQVVAASISDNLANGQPVEVVSVTNSTGVAVTYDLMLINATSPDALGNAAQTPAPTRMKYIPFGGFRIDGPNNTSVFNEWRTNSSTIFGHANMTEVITVGANDGAFYSPAAPRWYSSSGTAYVYAFDGAGNPVEPPVARQEPDTYAPDGVATTVPGFTHFAGTSAAAPHVAAIAALMLDANANLTPAQIQDAIRLRFPLADGAPPYTHLEANVVLPIALTSSTGGALTVNASVMADSISFSSFNSVLTMAFNNGYVRFNDTAVTSILVNSAAGVDTVTKDASVTDTFTVNGSGSAGGLFGTTLTVMGTTGADNISLSVSGTTLSVTKNGATTTYSTAAVASIVINANDGNDTVTVAQSVTIPATINGGSGNDTLTGGAGPDKVNGNGGNDIVDGGGSAADILTGGAGVDLANFITRSSALIVTLDGVANDGATGENDNVAFDLENVTTGGGADRITGSGNVANVFRGSGGNDTIFGGGGDDTLYGDSANDSLDGDAGNDVLWGGDGNDIVDGDTGADVFNGGAGTDLANYQYRSSSLNISLDGVANDGSAGEGDNVKTDVEDVTTGGGADTITGSSAVNKLTGGTNSDTITGNGGADSLYGGSGDDWLYGRDGVIDLLDGGAGSDRAQKDTNDTTVSVEVLLA